MEKILMIIAPKDFRDEEYLEPKAIFEQNDFEVITASTGVDIAIGKLGAKVPVVDITTINATDFVAVVLVGGSGALIYENNSQIKSIVQDFKNNFLLISAICIAPRILANLGFLKGLKATIYNQDNKQSEFLTQNGAIFIDQDVVEDKQLITANGPEAAKAFGKKIVKYLTLQ